MYFQVNLLPLFFLFYFELQFLALKIHSKETDIPTRPGLLEVKCSAAL